MFRRISLAILAAVSTFTVIGSTSSAVAREAIQDSYCLQGRTWGYPGNCAFSSYEQCMMTASGTDPLAGSTRSELTSSRSSGDLVEAATDVRLPTEITGDRDGLHPISETR